MKLDQARKRLLLIRGDELPATNEGTEEFSKQNYVGVSDAIELSWRDLKNQFSSASDLKNSHLQGLRDLNQKYSVARFDDVRRLENRYQAAWGHVNALNALCAEKAIYQPLTIICLRESLPSTLREDSLRKLDANDLGETAFDDLFVFLEQEIRVRRGSWRLGRHRNERSVPVAKPLEKSFHPFRTGERKKYRTGNRESWEGSSKHSSMLQDAQLLEDSEDLN